MSDEPVCESCGVPFIEHPGLVPTCAELTRLRAENAELRAKLDADTPTKGGDDDGE